MKRECNNICVNNCNAQFKSTEQTLFGSSEERFSGQLFFLVELHLIELCRIFRHFELSKSTNGIELLQIP